MKYIYSYSGKGTAKYNEDIVGSFNNVAWVIDGATPIFNENYISDENDVVWLVEEINKWLPIFICDEHSLEKILHNTLNKVRQIANEINDKLIEINNYKLPTFTIVIIRLIENKLEFYILGDCGMLVHTKSKTHYITDKRIDRFSISDKNNTEKMRTLNQKNKDVINLSSLRETRKLLNSKNGYWIGSLDAKGIPHGIKGTLEIDENSRILCFSDGYARLFELYNIVKISSFSFDLDFIKNTVKQVRSIEEKDENCTLYPRAKQSDDLSIILIENSKNC